MTIVIRLIKSANLAIVPAGLSFYNKKQKNRELGIRKEETSTTHF